MTDPSKFRPEEMRADAGAYEQPSLEPGTYTVQILAFKPDIQTKNGPRAVVDFEGVDGGTALWISAPDPATGKKGNQWQYRALAQAIGQDAVLEYEDKDAEGYSRFSPGDFVGRWVQIEVGGYGVDKVSKANPDTVKAIEVFAKTTPQTEEAKKEVVPDDIPF